MKLDIKKDGAKKTPHLAICHEGQGGSANNRHISLLMKSDTIELTDEIMKSIEKFGVENFPEEIQKAMSMKNQSMLLQNALKEAYCDKDEWLCVEDWKDGQVYFSTGDYDGWEMMVTSFTMTEDGVVTVGSTASPVVQITDYMIVDGKVKLSEEAEDKLETGLYEIVSKSVNKADAQLKLFKAVTEFKESLEKASTSIVADSDDINVNKSKDVENPLEINQEILKSSEVQALIAAEIEKATKQQNERIEQLEKAKEEAEQERLELIKAQEEADKAQMLEVFKGYSFVTEEEAVALTDALFKSEASVLVMNTLEKAKEAMSSVVEKEAGIEAEVEVNTDLEKSKSRVAEILKARKQKK
ncbi:hypothetical protein BNNNBJKE_00002 [Aeromonas phage vB_AdhM_DL]|nr:hypothetical protein BNCALIDO_00056 [Aeromonas phage vB_AdhM_TS9]WBF79587.1 hypothetical protein BNNNBJKE_00002 [Aeromonas phage vB_AdhM_DL]